jgi:hypothetical protein
MTTNQNRQPKGTETGGQFAASVNPESTVDLGDVEQNQLRVTSSNGVEFEVRIIREGDRYGMWDCLMNDSSNKFFNENDPVMVEFWDAGQDPDVFQDGCQFTGGRYGLHSLLENSDKGYGLNLYGGEPRWSIDGKAMKTIYEWLEPIATEAKDAR